MKDKKMVSGQSLCIMNNIPTPYRSSLFYEVSRQANKVGIEFSVLYLAETETVRDWKVELSIFESVLPVVWQQRNYRTPTSDTIVNVRYFSQTLKQRHLILFGYNYLTYVVVACMRAVLRRPTHLFCETTLSDNVSLKWKKAVKSFFFRVVFDQFFVPGKRSADYLTAHGVAKENIVFARNNSPIYPDVPPILEQTLGLRLLFVGRLASEKRILEFVQIFSKLKSHHQLSIVGSGPDADEILTFSEICPAIEILGEIENNKLPEIYGRHDVLVLVSESEPWGLVVNEAVNFGLALLLSRSVGSAPDLLDGNGEYLEEITVDRLNDALEKIKNNLINYRKQSLRIAAESTLSHQASSFLSVAKGDYHIKS
ncbi:glycosyltransferase family 4 protein [Amylibacter sp.]|nr:glycosyltransferase family 4 protein [Amylibacter sp.]